MTDEQYQEAKATLNKLFTAMGQTFGHPYFPDDPENINNADFQAGYKIGLLGEKISIADNNHPITKEWQRRGYPNNAEESFSSWKRGYWSGRYSAIAEKE
jgi:hypothetical protein